MDTSKPTYLIVNADDFGRSRGVNGAIAKAHEQGIVTSASLLVRRPFAKEAAAYAREHPDLSVGLHVDLGEWVYREPEGWTPVYGLPIHSGESVEDEVSAQVEAFRRCVGRDPTHVDSHQHVHSREPVRSVLKETAAAHRIPLRHHSAAVRYCGIFYGQAKDGSSLPERVSAEALIRILQALEPGYTELCCHPDEDRMGATEVDALCDPLVRAALEASRVELHSFHALADG